MESTENPGGLNPFPEQAYRRAIIKLSELGQEIKKIDEINPEYAAITYFILHYLQVSGNLMKDIRMLADLRENPNKISTEVTPRVSTEKPRLTVETPSPSTSEIQGNPPGAGS